MELGDLYVKPLSVKVPAGTELILKVTNAGAMAHDLKLEGGETGTKLLDPGATEEVSLGSTRPWRPRPAAPSTPSPSTSPRRSLRWRPASRRSIAGDETESAFAKAIMKLAHSLELETVAEGVEAGDQVAELRGLNCDLGQGYYFAKPLAAEGIDALLSAASAPQYSLANQRL